MTTPTSGDSAAPTNSFPGIKPAANQNGQDDHDDGSLIEPHNNKYVLNGDYGIRSDDSGSLTILNNHGKRGFTVTRSTASGSRVTAYPNIFRGWQWGAGPNGPWPVRVSGAGTPRVDFPARQAWKGTYDASLGKPRATA